VEYDIKEYPDAGHSFLNNQPRHARARAARPGRTPRLPRFFAILMWLLGR